MSIAQSNQQKLDDIIAERKGKLEYIDHMVKRVSDETVRIVSDEEKFITKKKEFRYAGGRFVDQGIPYHIHYTFDLDEYYMTGYGHDIKTSKIIYKTSNQTNFSDYNQLNKQSRLKISETRVPPTDSDYENKSYTRYFAVLANNLESGGFEVSADDNDTSSLYIFTSMVWRISGNIKKAAVRNLKELKKAQKIIPNIKKIVPILEYFVIEESLTPKQLVKKKLGIQGTEY
tara:strand:+ start:886 stop:1575 length:690 start_codon:yes stop_codon:yes gene_type:complete